ncbi:MAG: EAL domain-containing protein, partial [Tissierellia bacterium]|nr:EAL domain-containing protein [Tissierellia bacterium]
EVVAEGVETHEQRESLIAGGCNIMQGYLFSRPVTKAKVIEFIKKYKGGVSL